MRLGHGEFPEYRASLPDDTDVVRTCLEENEHDGWLARYWGIVEFVVFSDNNWLYHSVPHHSHVREINATTDGFIEELNDALRTVAVKLDYEFEVHDCEAI